MERQELLNGLRECKTYISEMEMNQKELHKIKNSYRRELAHMPLKKYWKGSKGVFKTIGLFLKVALAFLVFVLVLNIRFKFMVTNWAQDYTGIHILQVPLYAFLLIGLYGNDEFMALATADDLAMVQRDLIKSGYILLIMLGVLVVLPIIIRILINRSIGKYNVNITNQNLLIDQTNADNDKYNLEMHEQEKVTVARINQIKTDYAANIAPWFPPDYLCPDAINFFIHALENQSANDIQGMVNLYEGDCHKRSLEANQQKMLDEQKQIAKQQMLGDLLTVGNLPMSVANGRAVYAGAIEKNTEVVSNQRTNHF